MSYNVWNLQSEKSIYYKTFLLFFITMYEIVHFSLSEQLSVTIIIINNIYELEILHNHVIQLTCSGQIRIFN